MVARGAHGANVSSLQQRLNEAGANPPLAVDGAFGPLTQAAVRQFQQQRGLTVDGIVGPRTRGVTRGVRPTKHAALGFSPPHKLAG